MFSVFFFNDTATTEIYTLSLHDALPIFPRQLVSRPHQLGLLYSSLAAQKRVHALVGQACVTGGDATIGATLLHFADRKSTRLNSSHANISYAVFCLKKKHIVRRNTQPSR